MKHYLIHDKHGNFIGYSDDKKYLKDLKNRKGTYKITKINDDDIPKEISNSYKFSQYRLEPYCGYFTNPKLKLFNKEIGMFEDTMIEDALRLQSSICGLLENLDYLKIPREIKDIITANFEALVDRLSSITESNEILFDEVFDIDKHFYNRFLNKKIAFYNNFNNTIKGCDNYESSED